MLPLNDITIREGVMINAFLNVYNASGIDILPALKDLADYALNDIITNGEQEFARILNNIIPSTFIISGITTHLTDQILFSIVSKAAAFNNDYTKIVDDIINTMFIIKNDILGVTRQMSLVSTTSPYIIIRSALKRIMLSGIQSVTTPVIDPITTNTRYDTFATYDIDTTPNVVLDILNTQNFVLNSATDITSTITATSFKDNNSGVIIINTPASVLTNRPNTNTLRNITFGNNFKINFPNDLSIETNYKYEFHYIVVGLVINLQLVSKEIIDTTPSMIGGLTVESYGWNNSMIVDFTDAIGEASNLFTYDVYLDNILVSTNYTRGDIITDTTITTGSTHILKVVSNGNGKQSDTTLNFTVSNATQRIL